MKDAETRFWERTKKTDACWLWIGSKNKRGYGQMSVAGKMTKMHRFSWQLHNGSIPKGMCICHSCDTPSCVNPSHLWLGTQQENIKDRDEKGRRPPPQGEKNGSSRLTEVQVREILEKYRNGMQRKTLATQYGVSSSLVSHIITKRVWSHVS